jgi:hypothetical protein
MRSFQALALLLGIALVCVVIITVPSCVNYIFAPPADWLRHREERLKVSRETIQRLRKRNGSKPVKEWPERDRIIWENAKRLLAEAGENVSDEPPAKNPDR